MFEASSMTFSICSMAMPNLFSANPVVMLACVCAPIFGLIRNATLAILPFLPASSFITSNSGMLSTLKQAMPLSSPRFISQSLFPTPAYTIDAGRNPAPIAAFISPPLTQSAPKPYRLMSRNSFSLALAFTA